MKNNELRFIGSVVAIADCFPSKHLLELLD